MNTGIVCSTLADPQNVRNLTIVKKASPVENPLDQGGEVTNWLFAVCLWSLALC